jgi:prepilin-type N-terminal cleavage/methylation domain-containing protein
MMRMRCTKFIQKGDTMIEVMIALAIIGSVIAMSYATASRALRVGQEAQERTEAVKLVESQIETLKASAGALAKPVPTVFAGPYTVGPPANTSFCFAGSTTPIVNKKFAPSDPFADNLKTQNGALPMTVADTYAFACAQGTVDSSSGRYKLSIERKDKQVVVTDPVTSTFTVRARWQMASGSIGQVEVLYKLHGGMF